MVKHVDSGGQVHLVTNIRKPRKWRRYEYLLSSGTLWIDTGVGLASNIKIEMSFIVTNTSSIGMLIGAYYDNVSAPKCQAYTQNNKFSIVGFSSNITSGTTCTANQMYNLTLTASTASMNTDVPLWLFARSNDINNIIRHPGLKIYNTKIYSNDTLARDFVPAQYNGQYGMWDLVEDKFYRNAGTGTFTVGPEMKNYDEIYEVRKTSSLLPAGVELYDYIQSSGTLWIDTGYYLNENTKVDLTVSFNTVAQDGYAGFFGSQIDSAADTSSLALYIYGQKLWEDSGGLSFYGSDNALLINTKYNIIIDLSNTTTNGVVKANIDFPDKTCTKPLSIGRVRRTDGTTYTIHSGVHFYAVKIYDNDQLIRNFLPCTYLGEPGMWDTVENKFYRNQGTGLFTLGNKITLKQYEYLESSGTLYIDTGIAMSSDVGASMQYEMTINEWGDYCLLGVGDDRFRWGFEVYIDRGNNNHIQTAGLAYIGSSWQNYKCSSLTTYNILYNYNNDQNVFLNGTSIRTGLPTGNLNTGNIWMFGFNYGGDSGSYEGKGTLWRGAKAKIYSCQITKNGVVVRNFIPVSYNGTPGLWDKVEWKFYANAGSGSFTLGPEKASGIYPVSYLHDRTVYEEPDGSKWLRIVHHNNPSVRRFNLSDSFTTYVHTSEDLWFDASWCNTLTRWELMVKQKPTSSSAEQKYRWVQNVNPMIATFSNTKRANVTYNTSSGYTTPESSFGGLYRVASLYNYLNGNNNTDGNWWGSIGNCTIYSGGLPGWNSLVITTGYEDLYVRIA